MINWLLKVLSGEAETAAAAKALGLATEPLVDVAPEPEPEPALDISEPVIAIIESFKDADNWELLDDTESPFSRIVKVEHVGNGLVLELYKRISISRYRSAELEFRTRALCLWMTGDEAFAVGIAFENWRALARERAKELAEQEAQRERQRVMALFNN